MDSINEEKALESPSNDKADSLPSSCLLQGVIFSKSVRSAFCSFHVAVPSEQDQMTDDLDSESDDEAIVMVRLQFPVDANISFRSLCRRLYKLGDLVCFANGSWNGDINASSPRTCNSEWRARKLILEPDNLQNLQAMVRVERVRHWDMTRCQKLQLQYCHQKDYWMPATANNQHQQQEHTQTLSSKPPIWMDHPSGVDSSPAVVNAHASGLEKRIQAEYVARFLVHMIMHKLRLAACPKAKSSSIIADPASWATTDPRTVDSKLFRQAVDWLNQGSGVVDAAGGSGHVSMQLGLLGIRSTVIDAREAVGKLPGRDRKIWNHALKRSRAAANDTLYCQPIVEYDARRGWFGPLLDGVDASYRHPDEESLVVYDLKHSLVAGCSAIVALHPDEATEAIVSMAVDALKPLVVVPCCVFARLFPKRIKAARAEPVSTRLDLLEYLTAKHESIRQSVLPFQGANTILWTDFISQSDLEKH